MNEGISTGDLVRRPDQMWSGTSGQGGARPVIRVLHLYRRFHPDYTGDGIYYSRLIPYLAEHGIHSEVLAYETEPPGRPETIVHLGTPVHYLASQYRMVSKRALLFWLLKNLHRFDVVHLHSHVDRQFLSYILARICNRRVLFSCTLDDSPTQLLQDYQEKNQWLVSLLMRSISVFVVISPHLMRRALETVKRDRLCFIPQGTQLPARVQDGRPRAAAREALGFRQDEFLLVNVGSISRRKNVAFLVEALARLDDRSARLVIVGPAVEPDYEAEVLSLAASLGVADRVTFAGFQQDAAAFYVAADAFVFASFAEGFPNVFVEAMAHGLPIVTMFLPGLTDFVVDHGVSGFLAADMDQFVSALATLRADPGRCVDMGRASRRFAERNLEIGRVARSYVSLYRGDSGAHAQRGVTDFPDLDIHFSDVVAAGPRAFSLEEIDTPTDWRPQLQVVIDTEADFDWDKGVRTDVGRTHSIVGLERQFDVFRAHGVRPALVLDYPVVSQVESRAIVRRLAAEGCELGVHLHSWSTPPSVEGKDDWHSFSCNLGPRLERRKLAALSDAVAELAGARVGLYKAGRYGLGPSTLDNIEELGFVMDLSICPAYDYSPIGGPDFRRFTSRPGWMGRAGQILSLPTTAARIGWMAGSPIVERIARARWSRRFGVDRLLARAEAAYPLRLSPEGTKPAELRALTRDLLRSGLRVFSLSVHSPSFGIGNTPYVRSEEDLKRLVSSLDSYLRFFRDEIGGEFTAPSALHARLTALRKGGLAPA